MHTAICNNSFTFTTWKSLKLGTHKSAKDLSKGLTKAGFRISRWADAILKKVVIVNAETEIELVNVSVRELGFTDGATRGLVYARARELGLDLIPSEVGPQLRLQYPTQPPREWVLMAMEPIADSDGNLDVFDIEHYKHDLWLHARNGHSDHFWGAEVRWVFGRHKNT